MTTIATAFRGPLGGGLLVLAAVLAFPAQAADSLLFALRSLLAVGPVILVALLLTAAATASGAISLISTAMRGSQVRMILLASLVGALTPVCGITVFPLVAGLIAGGVPLAPIMAFWLSSPVTDPGMLAITAATLGLDFALGKTLAALGCGLVGGAVVLVANSAGYLANPQRPGRDLGALHGGCGCAAEVRWRFWREAARRAQFRETALATGRLMLLWLSLAFVVEYFLRLHVPETWVVSLVGGDTAFAVPLAAIVGTPIYLEGYAALPLIRGLIDSGMRPDAAMAFLVAGGITSAWAAIPVYSLVRLPVFALYLGLALACSMLAGWGYGLALP